MKLPTLPHTVHTVQPKPLKERPKSQYDLPTYTSQQQHGGGNTGMTAFNNIHPQQQQQQQGGNSRGGPLGMNTGGAHYGSMPLGYGASQHSTYQTYPQQPPQQQQQHQPHVQSRESPNSQYNSPPPYGGYQVLPPPVAAKPAKGSGSGKGRAPENPQTSPSLSASVQPILSQLREGYGAEFRRVGRPLPLLEVIGELQNAFDLSERSCPGLTDELVSALLTRMVTKPSQHAQQASEDIRKAMEKIKR